MSSRRIDIDHDLIQWALWSKRGSDPGIGYPPMTPTRRISGAPLEWEYDINHVPIAITISDDRAIRIDKAIASLELDLRTTIYLKYQREFQIIKIAKAMRLSRDKVSQNIQTAKRVLQHIL